MAELAKNIAAITVDYHSDYNEGFVRCQNAKTI